MTKMSSRGQVVIPIEMRKDFCVGEKLVVLSHKKKLVFRRVSDMGKKFMEDLEFRKRTNKILDDYKNGKAGFTTMTGDEFLEEIKTW